MFIIHFFSFREIIIIIIKRTDDLLNDEFFITVVCFYCLWLHYSQSKELFSRRSRETRITDTLLHSYLSSQIGFPITQVYPNTEFPGSLTGRQIYVLGDPITRFNITIHLYFTILSPFIGDYLSFP